MKTNCDIIRDLLPLYAENLTSAESRRLVEEHLAECPACRAELESLKKPGVPLRETGGEPLRKIKNTICRQRRLSVALGILAALMAALVVFNLLSAPEYLPFSEDLATVYEQPGGTVVIRFNQSLQGYDRFVTDSDGAEGSIYYFSAWNSIWNRLIQKNEPQTVVLNPDGEQVSAVYYYDSADPDGAPVQLVYGTDNGGEDSACLILPRLVLGYYFVSALGLAVLLFILLLILRKDKKARAILEKLLALPLSYLAATVLIKGFRTITYAALRDFLFILVLTGLLYAAALILQGLLAAKRSEKTI